MLMNQTQVTRSLLVRPPEPFEVEDPETSICKLNMDRPTKGELS